VSLVLGPQALFAGRCRIVRMVKDERQICKAFYRDEGDAWDKSNPNPPLTTRDLKSF
jgi:hypothetical protein